MICKILTRKIFLQSPIIANEATYIFHTLPSYTPLIKHIIYLHRQETINMQKKKIHRKSLQNHDYSLHMLQKANILQTEITPPNPLQS